MRREALVGDTDNVRAAIEFALMMAHADTAALLITWTFLLPFDQREVEQWVQRALALPGGAIGPTRHALLESGAKAALALGQTGRAAAMFDEVVGARRGGADVHGFLRALEGVGIAAVAEGRYDDARAAFSECRGILERLGEERGVRIAQASLAAVERRAGRYDAALDLLEPVVAAARTSEDVLHVAALVHDLGDVELHRGRLDAARARYAEAIGMAMRSWTGRRIVAYCIAGLAAAAARAGERRDAAVLWGALARLEEEPGTAIDEPDRVEYAGFVGNPDAEGYAEGRRLPLQEAIRRAVAAVD